MQRKKSYIEGYKLLLNLSQNFMPTRAGVETQSFGSKTLPIIVTSTQVI
jgi:hypothetical protein